MTCRFGNGSDAFDTINNETQMPQAEQQVRVVETEIRLEVPGRVGRLIVDVGLRKLPRSGRQKRQTMIGCVWARW